jgi:toxin-antitoxin system PIN domain toxin
VIALLDVDVLVALFDPSHVHHEAAHTWFAQNRTQGWATCPITENGFLGVVSNPAYPGRRCATSDALARLQAFADSGDHHFWPDSTSLRRSSRLDSALLGGHDRVVGIYLLLLAVDRGGRLATFDDEIAIGAVRQAGSEHVAVLGPAVI